MMGRNDPCWCGSGKKWKKCHFPHQCHSLAQEYLKKYRIVLKNEAQIQGIRRACHLAARILAAAAAQAKEGVTTNEIDRLVARLHAEAGALSACLGYGSPPFPKSVCTSLNDVVCHGIPNDLPLRQGDILNIDVATLYQGYYGDCSCMITIPPLAPQSQLVCDVSAQALARAMALCRPGLLVKEIGETIESYATAQGCSVIYQFVGHGVGLHMHEPPQIPHNRNTSSIPLAPGMIFTIEPMINAGSAEITIDPENRWEARTQDGLPSAQWEHTLLITDEGHEILTLLE